MSGVLEFALNTLQVSLLFQLPYRLGYFAPGIGRALEAQRSMSDVAYHTVISTATSNNEPRTSPGLEDASITKHIQKAPLVSPE